MNWVTVITGAASGIGKATAIKFTGEGSVVIVADLNEEKGGLVVEEIRSAGGQAVFHPVDVSDVSSVEALAEFVDSEYGTPLNLVNSAGILQNRSRIEDFDLNEHDRVWAVNYRGTYLCCRVFGPRMAKSGTGCIVNISSTSSIASFPILAYGPGKAALDRLTSILAAELGPSGVRVNAIMPGYVLTEQMKERISAGLRDPTVMNEQSALGRMVEASEVAEGIFFLCSKAASAISGTTLLVDAGWSANVTYRQYPGGVP